MNPPNLAKRIRGSWSKEITGQDFTAKDFRTWAGTLLAAIELEQLGKFDSAKQAQKNIVRAIKNVAKQLGNRPATCRKYYPSSVTFRKTL